VIADADIVRRITDRAQAVLGERVAFNEVLSVLYREGQKMSWHDDGEEGNWVVLLYDTEPTRAVLCWRRG
jgi:alkylated DNA repair dioxygenase AlkB